MERKGSRGSIRSDKKKNEKKGVFPRVTGSLLFPSTALTAANLHINRNGSSLIVDYKKRKKKSITSKS